MLTNLHVPKLRPSRRKQLVFHGSPFVLVSLSYDMFFIRPPSSTCPPGMGEKLLQTLATTFGLPNCSWTGPSSLPDFCPQGKSAEYFGRAEVRLTRAPGRC